MVWQDPASRIAVIGVYIQLDGSSVNGSSGSGANATRSSPLLETVFSSVEDIQTPGTATETKPLVMSGLVQTLNRGSFQR
jgi:hypothetical protein